MPFVFVCLAVVCPAVMFAGCGDEAPSTPPKDAANDVIEADVVQCHSAQVRESGACCENGHYYDFESDECRSVGLAACRDVLPSKPAACAPRWCPAWEAFDGGPCKSADCVPTGGTCTPTVDGDTGCEAGSWRPGPGLACKPAGAPMGALHDAVPKGVPKLVPLPKLSATSFCSRDGKTVICDTEPGSCGKGRMPDPDAPDTCIDVGVPWECPASFKADPKAPYKPQLVTPCLKDVAACEKSLWGGAALPKDALHVKAGAKGGDGTSKAPFGTLYAAMKAVQPGGVVALHDGAYEGGLTIAKPVVIRGKCAAKVSISNTTSGAVLAVEATPTSASVTIAGVTLDGGVVGLHVKPGATVALRRVHVDDATKFGVHVDGGRIAMQECLVSGTKLLGKYHGQGIRIDHGGHASLRRVRVHKNRKYGVDVADKDSVLEARDVIIDGTESDGSIGMLGYGLMVADFARATVVSARISNNRDAAVTALGKGVLDMRATIIDRTRHQGFSWNYGYGLQVFGLSQVQLHGVRIHANHSCGMDVDGDGTRVTADGLIIDDTRSQIGNGLRGEGIAVTSRGYVRLRSARISKSQAAGMRAEGVNSTIEVHGVLIDNVRPDVGGKSGVGAYAVNTGVLKGRGLRITDARASGLIVLGKQAHGDLEDVLVDGTRSTLAVGGQGYGALIGDTGFVRLKNARFSGNRGAGVMVINDGTLLRARDLVVDATAATSPAKATGHGLAVADGARAIVAGGRLSANHVAGASIQDPKSRLDLAGVLVDANRADSKEKASGVGVAVDTGTSVTLHGCRVRGNRYLGIAVQQAIDPVRIVGTVVEKTLPAQVGMFPYGMGLTITSGTAKAAILASRFDRNRAAGIMVFDAAVTMRDLVVSSTATETLIIQAAGGKEVPAKVGDGILAHRATPLTIHNAVLTDHARAGLVLQDVKSGVLHGVQVSGCEIGRTGTNNSIEVSNTLLVDNVVDLETGQSRAMPAPPSLAGF